MRTLRNGLDPGATATTMRYLTACEILTKQEELISRGLLEEGTEVLFDFGRIAARHFVGWDYKPGDPITAVTTQAKLRVYVVQPDNTRMALPVTIVKIVQDQVEDVLYPAEIYDTWQLSAHKHSWYSRVLKLHILRGIPALQPARATQSEINNVQARVEDPDAVANSLRREKQGFDTEIYLMASQRTHIPHGAEVTVRVAQEYEEVEGDAGDWISALDHVDDMDDSAYRVRPGLVEGNKLEEVRVIGTKAGGSVIEKGEPIAVRRTATREEMDRATQELEAIAEGRKGMQEHEQRRAQDLIFQQQQGF
jgi:hypothetical protein